MRTQAVTPLGLVVKRCRAIAQAVVEGNPSLGVLDDQRFCGPGGGAMKPIYGEIISRSPDLFWLLDSIASAPTTFEEA